jgi:hypothetical protein
MAVDRAARRLTVCDDLRRVPEATPVSHVPFGSIASVSLAVHSRFAPIPRLLDAGAKGQFRTYACSLDYITTVAIPAASAIVR